MGFISGAASATAAKKQAKAQKKIARMQVKAQYEIAEAGAGEREVLSQRAQAEGELALRQRRSAEEAQINVFSSLGQAGTYDMPRTRGPLGLGSLAPGGLEGIRTGGLLAGGEDFYRTGEVTAEDVRMRNLEGGQRKKAASWTKKWSVEGKVMDPDAMAGQIKSTSGFRQVSRMVAESEQLLNREGRLWEELNNSIVGGIYESSASLQRQAMEDLSRNMARGGAARNQAMAAAQKYQVQESINRQRTGALWQSKLGLEQWVRANAASTQNFAMAWTQNQSGIRDTFTANLTNLSTFWTQAMTPGLLSASVTAQGQTQQGVLAAQDMFNEAAKTKSAMYAGIAAAAKGGISDILSGVMGGKK